MSASAANIEQEAEQLSPAWTAGERGPPAFTSGQGYSADADYSPRAWLETTFGGAGVLPGT